MVVVSAVFLFQVKITINGETREIEEGLSVIELLEQLSIRSGRVVLELNRDVLSRDAYSKTILKQDDNLEIVHFVGGG